MTERTIALFDVIGIKQAFEKGTAEDLFKKFWEAVEAWTNTDAGNQKMRPIPGVRARQKPDLHVRTFSDSAILMLRPEFGLDDFFEIAQSLKHAIERRELRSYVVVAKGDLVEASKHPATGCFTMDSDFTRAYENVIGSGAAWVNAYHADLVVGRTKDWHDKYSVYAVDGAIPTSMTPADSREFKGFGGQPLKVHALTPLKSP